MSYLSKKTPEKPLIFDVKSADHFLPACLKIETPVKFPYMAISGRATLVDALAGGDGKNDISMMDAVVAFLSFESCPADVTDHATHLVGGAPGRSVHENALEVLDRASMILDVLSRAVR